MTDLVADRDFGELVDSMCTRPGMYVTPPTFDTVAAYIDGFDAALRGGILVGLHQWLVKKRDTGNNVAWPGIASTLIGADPNAPGTDVEHRRIRALGNLLLEFIEYRRSNGLTKIFCEYRDWLSSQSWYDGPLQDATSRGRARRRKK